MGVVATVAKYCDFTLSELDKEIDEEDSGNREVVLDDVLPKDDELDEAFMSDDEDLDDFDDEIEYEVTDGE